MAITFDVGIIERWNSFDISNCRRWILL